MRANTFMMFLAGLLSAASAQDCTTPLGIPCMIIESVHEQWSVLNNGINYHHSKRYQKSGYSSNGSIADVMTFEEIPLIGAAEMIGPTAYLYLAPSDRVVHLFHKDRKFSSREPIIWHDRPYRRAKNGDTTCASGILHSGTDFRLTGEHTILGTKTFRWYRPLENSGYEEQFLAPALDCLALRGVRVHKNILRFPVFTDRSEAISVRFGEPDRALFEIPTDYQQVPDPAPSQTYLFMLESTTAATSSNPIDGRDIRPAVGSHRHLDFPMQYVNTLANAFALPPRAREDKAARSEPPARPEQSS